MNSLDPTTWLDLANHPQFEGRRFDASWYDGDIGDDLALLRLAAISILKAMSDLTCELVVLDDTTTYFIVRTKDSLIAEVYPSTNDNGRRCYFLDFPAVSGEIRLDTVQQVTDLLHDHHGPLT